MAVAGGGVSGGRPAGAVPVLGERALAAGRRPVAQQSDALPHETPVSWALAAPRGAGPGTRDHRVPFQCSIRFVMTPGRDWPPTAQQSLVLTQNTPSSCRLTSVLPKATFRPG